MAKRRGPIQPTKKHLARAERERIITRNILIVTAVVLVVVIGLIGYGFIDQAIIKPRETVAIVNDETITSEAFEKRVRYERGQLVIQYINTLTTMQQFGSDESVLSFFNNSLSQIDLQLENATFLGQDVLDRMVDEILIRQEADRLGISVSKAEIDGTIQELFSYFPNGTPTPTSSPVPLATSTLSALQQSLITATPALESSPTESPIATETAEGETTPTAIPPTPTPFTRDAYETTFAQFLNSVSGWTELSENSLEDVLLIITEADLYRQKLFDELTANVPQSQEQVWARHILVEDEETALNVLQRLDDGDDWTNLAAEFSTDESNKDRGGDLDWFPRGQMVSEFEEAAFELDIGGISEPVESSFGWHIIQALGHEIRSIQDFEYQRVREQAFTEWLSQTRLDSNPEILDTWESRVPNDPDIPPQVRAAAQQINLQLATPAIPDPAATPAIEPTEP
jgi:parvulin-like peptidyl-prolyl isomerase